MNYCVFKGLSGEDVNLALKITIADFVVHNKTTYDEFEVALVISINLIKNLNKKKDTFKSGGQH